MKKLIKKTTTKILSVLLACMFLLSSAGCSQKSSTSNSSSTGYKDEITIDYYSASVNYSGIIGGWFGKTIKDKFNMKINIISPNVSGAAIFQTRSAAGNLGDLICLNQSQLTDSVKAGLMMDMTTLLKDHGSNYLKMRLKQSIQSKQF